MTRYTLSKRIGALAVALSLVFGGAACSDDDEDTETPGTENNGVDLGEEVDELGDELDEGTNELGDQLDGEG